MSINKSLEKKTRKERIKRRNYNERRKVAKRKPKELTEGDKMMIAALIYTTAKIFTPILDKIHTDYILSDDTLEEDKNGID